MSSVIEKQIDFETQDVSDHNNQQEDSWLRYLPVIFRSLGALAVLISLYTFLSRGWDAGTDLTRYFIFIGHTAALALVGLINAKFIREAKGARLLLILALVSIPVNFAILGGFIFAGSNIDNLIDYPQYVSWSVGGLDTALILTLVALTVMIPVCLLGFKVLLRNVSMKASILFLFSNLVLLIPFRQPELVAIFSIVLGGGLFVFYRQYLSKQIALKTFEGKISFALQFMPLTILLGRNFWLYQFDSILISSVSFILFAVIRQISLLLVERSTYRILMELISVVLVFVCSFSFGYSLFKINIALEIVIASITLVSAAAIFELSLRGKLRAASYRIFATFIALTGLLLNFWLHTSLLSAFIILIAGVAMLFASYLYQQKAFFIGGLVLVLTGFYYHVTLLMGLFEMNYWIALTALGILFIVSGSYLEANSHKIKVRLKQTKHQLSDWEF